MGDCPLCFVSVLSIPAFVLPSPGSVLLTDCMPPKEKKIYFLDKEYLPLALSERAFWTQQKVLYGPKYEIYSSNAATTKQERDQVEKCARDALVLHFPVCADWLDDWSKQASNRFSLSTSPLPMCRWAAISEIVSQEWLRTPFLWTRIKSDTAFPRQGQPGRNSGDRAHRDWFRPSYWHPTSQNRRHQKGAWDCSRALLWLCFFLLLRFLFMWPDFHVIFFHVLWTSFVFSLLLPWGRTEVLWDVCPPANTKKEPQKSTQRLSCA